MILLFPSQKLDESAGGEGRPAVRRIVNSALYSDTDDDQTGSLSDLQVKFGR